MAAVLYMEEELKEVRSGRCKNVETVDSEPSKITGERQLMPVNHMMDSDRTSVICYKTLSICGLGPLAE